MVGRRLVGVLRVFGPGRPQEDSPVHLDEARDRQRADQGQGRGGESCPGERNPCSVPERAEQAEVDEELTDETVQGRQATDGDGTDQEAECQSTASASPDRRDGRSRGCGQHG